MVSIRNRELLVLAEKNAHYPSRINTLKEACSVIMSQSTHRLQVV